MTYGELRSHQQPISRKWNREREKNMLLYPPQREISTKARAFRCAKMIKERDGVRTGVERG